MWEVHYSQEVATYLEDNTTLIASLFFATESLAASKGIPDDDRYQEVEGVIFWNVQNHVVVYRRFEASEIIRVLALKPE